MLDRPYRFMTPFQWALQGALLVLSIAAVSLCGLVSLETWTERPLDSVTLVLGTLTTIFTAVGVWTFMDIVIMTLRWHHEDQQRERQHILRALTGKD